jgi:hypothetical protein
MTVLWALIDPIAPPKRDRYKSTHCFVWCNPAILDCMHREKVPG